MVKPKIEGVRFLERLGTNVATYRKVKNQTQAELAKAIGVDKETISRFERGIALPSLATLEKLGDKLQVPVVDLLGETPMPVDSTAVAITNLMKRLDEEERDYVYELIKFVCSQLQRRKARVERRKEPRPTRQ